MTLGAVKGFGHQQGLTEIYRGAEYAVDFLRKIKLKLLSQMSGLNVLSKYVEIRWQPLKWATAKSISCRSKKRFGCGQVRPIETPLAIAQLMSRKEYE